MAKEDQTLQDTGIGNGKIKYSVIDSCSGILYLFEIIIRKMPS